MDTIQKLNIIRYEASDMVEPSFPIIIQSFVSGEQNHLFDQYHKIVILYVQRGKCTFHLNGKSVEVQANQALIVNHTKISEEKSSLTKGLYYTIIFGQDIFKHTDNDIIQSKYVTPLLNGELSLPQLVKGETVWEKNVLLYLTEIINADFNHCPGYEMMIKGYIFLFFSTIISNYSSPGIRSSEKDFNNQCKMDMYRKAMFYIVDNYSQKITISDLAHHLNLSESQVNRFFKQMFLQTPLKTINYVRVNEACKILKTENESITDIATKVGFDSVGYFIKIFKKLKGCTPSEFRKLEPDCTKPLHM